MSLSYCSLHYLTWDWFRFIFTCKWILFYLLFLRTTEKEDMENKYNRVITSSLLAIRKLLTSLPSNEISSLSETMDNLLKDPKFWKHGKSQVISVWCFLLFSLYIYRKHMYYYIMDFIKLHIFFWMGRYPFDLKWRDRRE